VYRALYAGNSWKDIVQDNIEEKWRKSTMIDSYSIGVKSKTKCEKEISNNSLSSIDP
jgi:hypothetical protein